MSSSDDYYDDEPYADQDDDSFGEGGEGGTEQSGAAASVGWRSWLNKKRGWILMLVLALVQSVFALVMLRLGAQAKPVATMSQEHVRDLAIEMLGHEVAFNQIYQLVPMRGGRKMTIGLDIVLVLGQLPEERVEGADRPTAEEFDAYTAALQQLEPNIRSKVNTLLQQIPPDELGDPEIYKTIKEDVKTYANDMMDSLDFGKGVRTSLGKRRVTDVLIPMFIRQYL
jgi:Flagellar basal body-associated protein FliL.